MIKKRIKEFNEKASWLKEGVLYHRGKHWVGVNENTIEAFKLAIKDRKGVELDVRLTNDFEVVVSHDDNLKRIYGVDKDISKISYNEVKEISNGEIPLFSDVLELVSDKIPLMVEIKSSKVGVLEDKVYELLKNYKGRYVIVSFNPMTLKYFRKKDSGIIRGQLSYSYKDSDMNKLFKFALSRMWFNVFSKPHFISYGINGVNLNFLKKYAQKGYFIIGWTYKNEINKEDLKQVYDNMIIEDLEIEDF